MIGRPALDLADDDARQALAIGLTGRRWEDRAVLRDKAGRPVEVEVLIRPASADGRSTVWFVSGPSGPSADDDRGGGMLERACSQSSAAIVVWSPGLRLQWANELTCRLFNADVDRMRGRRLTEILTPDSQHYAVEEALRRARDTGTTQYVVTHEQVPGEKRPHEWALHIDPLRDEDGTVVGLCSMARENSAEFWARRRLILLNDARRSIGLSLDVGSTAQELTKLAVPDLADVAMVHLLPQALGARGAASRDPVEVRLAAASGRALPRPHPPGTWWTAGPCPVVPWPSAGPYGSTCRTRPRPGPGRRAASTGTRAEGPSACR